MDMKETEKSIENQILTYLKLKGVFAWKNQSVGVYDPRKKIYRKAHNKFHINGVADILGIHQGKLLAIEVKSPTGKLRPEQWQFLGKVDELGGIAIIARSVEDVQRGLGL